MSLIDVRQVDAFAVITMNRPEQRNALTLEFAADLRDTIRDVSADPAVRCVVVTGAGPAFCAGADLTFLSELVELPPADVASTVYGVFQGLVRAILEAPVPVIAAVNGGALGAGCDLALACDLRTVGDAGFFEETWGRLGLIPGMGGMVWATELLGLSRARRFLYRIERYTGSDAVDVGLAEECFPTAHLIEETLEWAMPIVAMDRTTLSYLKRGTARVRLQRLDDHFDQASTMQALRLSDATVRQRLGALL